MNELLKTLQGKSKLLFEVPLRPVLGQRFQPTGFPSLGAATYQTKNGLNLLVESAQSMANRLESVCWDDLTQGPVSELKGISYVKVNRKDKSGTSTFLTSSIVEAHRLNSPYILESSDKSFFDTLKADLGGLEIGPINRQLLSEVLLRYDVGSLIHGVFLAKKELAGGRLRVARALSAFVEAEGVRQAVSGGVKNDHVNPSGDTSTGFGNVPFSREEYTAEKISLYVNVDLAQIAGYGLGPDVEEMLILLCLFKVRTLVDGRLRFRTACDLQVATEHIVATEPSAFHLPAKSVLDAAVASAIAKCSNRMKTITIHYNDELKKSKDEGKSEKASESGDENS